MGASHKNIDMGKLPKPREIIPQTLSDGQSTIMNAAVANDDQLGGSAEMLCREIGLLKGAIHAMHQDQLSLQVHLMQMQAQNAA